MTPWAALSHAWGGSIGQAAVGRAPEDFLVSEQIGFAADGEGPHLLVEIRKRRLSTAAAMTALADHWSVDRRGMGYAGRKDRGAVTRQWLTVPWPVNSALPPAGPVPLRDADAALTVLSRRRHRRKLRVGALTGNRFWLCLRDVDADPRRLHQRFGCIARAGVPNYFGPQRFGRGAENLSRGLAWLRGGAPPHNRSDRGMLLSAVRSGCFNHLLSARVADGDWAQVRGIDEVFVLDGRGSLFTASDGDQPGLEHRLAGLRIHGTGPLPGRPRAGLPMPPTLAAREAGWLAAMDDVIAAMAEKGVEAGRRALRLVPAAMTWWPVAEGTWWLGFGLPAGGFATTVLREAVDWPEPGSAAQEHV
ncbi:tRNA pseudouridine(13) synthase TruD [Spiribacter pallidus]|uniref:tRNA pseudouridine(13) synthase TruD n=1 Tax=Spiribacter pallidus TaxID=1987936 RepID=UPI00349F3521